LFEGSRKASPHRAAQKMALRTVVAGLPEVFEAQSDLAVWRPLFTGLELVENRSLNLVHSLLLIFEEPLHCSDTAQVDRRSSFPHDRFVEHLPRRPDFDLAMW
jgi:hypothetical protein